MDWELGAQSEAITSLADWRSLTPRKMLGMLQALCAARFACAPAGSWKFAPRNEGNVTAKKLAEARKVIARDKRLRLLSNEVLRVGLKWISETARDECFGAEQFALWDALRNYEEAAEKEKL
jgi:hypothetical protein